MRMLAFGKKSVNVQGTHLDVFNADGRSVGVSGNAEKRDQSTEPISRRETESRTHLANISKSFPSDTDGDTAS